MRGYLVAAQIPDFDRLWMPGYAILATSSRIAAIFFRTADRARPNRATR
jgi:hypothetical protein